MSAITLPSNQGRLLAFEILRAQSVSRTNSGVAQVTSFPSRLWTMRLEIVLQVASVTAWDYAIQQLSDLANYFVYGPPTYSGPSTSYAGASPVVNGADQLGLTLAVDGMTPSAAILLEGDFLSFDVTSAGGNTNRQLNRCTANVTANGSGQASIPLMLPIRQSPADNATVNIATPTAFFSLDEPRGGLPAYTPLRGSEFVIQATERIFP